MILVGLSVSVIVILSLFTMCELKVGQDQSTFLGVVGGNHKGVFLCVVEGNGSNLCIIPDFEHKTYSAAALGC